VLGLRGGSAFGGGRRGLATRLGRLGGVGLRLAGSGLAIRLARGLAACLGGCRLGLRGLGGGLVVRSLRGRLLGALLLGGRLLGFGLGLRDRLFALGGGRLGATGSLRVRGVGSGCLATVSLAVGRLRGRLLRRRL